MRYTLMFVAFAVSTMATAQSPAQQSPVGIALNDWGTISGGLFLNERCHILGAEESAIFKSSVESIGPVLGENIGNSQIIGTIREGARRTAESDKYKDCGAPVPEIVRQTASFANNWAQQMRNIQEQQSGK